MSSSTDTKNLSNNINLLKQSAENGDKDAMYSLALLYKHEEEIEKNLEKALYWYKKAAENGTNNAMYNLTFLYKNGEGTEINLEKAFYWYLKQQKMVKKMQCIALHFYIKMVKE